ncbi:unnamed protein product [Rhizoctonia solani]|uniref:Uncharacterized protein n=1 Tax=Rhizoctonia solani TaxID=456999 RepID=A0A8H3CRJ1_9AGAM|nr:unnamed protein product [Rhizoctonia solani]
MSRFFTVLLVALTFSLVVWSHPIQADQGLIVRKDCTTGCKAVVILTNLKEELHPKLQSLRSHYKAHEDMNADIESIKTSFEQARADILALEQERFQSPTDVETNQIKQAARELITEVIEDWTGWELSRDYWEGARGDYWTDYWGDQGD